MVRLRAGTDVDLYRFGGDQADWVIARFPEREILVAERNGAVIGLGSILWDVRGHCWVFFDALTLRYRKTMHQQALLLMAGLKETEDVIYGWREERLTSSRWLTRLGFRYAGYVDEETGLEVWRWRRSQQ